MWRNAGGDGKGHGQRKGNEADGDSGDQVSDKFVTIVIAEKDYGFWEPRIDGDAHVLRTCFREAWDDCSNRSDVWRIGERRVFAGENRCW